MLDSVEAGLLLATKTWFVHKSKRKLPDASQKKLQERRQHLLPHRGVNCCEAYESPLYALTN